MWKAFTWSGFSGMRSGFVTILLGGEEVRERVGERWHVDGRADADEVLVVPGEVDAEGPAEQAVAEGLDGGDEAAHWMPMSW